MLVALQYVEGTAAGGGWMASFGTGNKVIGGGALTNAVGPADLQSSDWWGALPDQPADGFLSTTSGSAIFTDTHVITVSSHISRTFKLAFGDADNDGYPDLAVGNHDWNQVYWNNGDYTFDCGDTFEGGPTFDVDWGHMNNDDDLDLVVADSQWHPNWVCLNNGDHTFTCTSFSICSGSKGGVASLCLTALADVDGDSDLDIALGNRFAQNLIYYNDGTGTSFPITTTVCSDYDYETWTMDLEFGDVDNDNDRDLVAAGNGPGYVCINDPPGTFTECRQFPYRPYTSSVALDDADGDGDLDIAMGNVDGDHPIEIYLNDGHGYFTGPLLVGPASDMTLDLAWGDVDNDGDPDLAVVNYDQQNVVYFNDPVTATNSITFTRKLFFGTGSSSVAFGDVDNDGDLDLAVGNDGQQNVVYINTLVVAPASVDIAGPTTGTVDTAHPFIATVRPITATAHPMTATQPITYVWQATGQSPVTHIGSLNDTITFTWPTPGIQTITVTATNAGGAVTGTHIITTDESIAGLIATNDSPTELGDATTLTATITAGSNVTYTWAFGDGVTGSGAVVTHTYTDIDIYTAAVTASNSVSVLTATTTVPITPVFIYLPSLLKNYLPLDQSFHRVAIPAVVELIHGLPH